MDLFSIFTDILTLIFLIIGSIAGLKYILLTYFNYRIRKEAFKEKTDKEKIKAWHRKLMLLKLASPYRNREEYLDQITNELENLNLTLQSFENYSSLQEKYSSLSPREKEELKRELNKGAPTEQDLKDLGVNNKAKKE